jgi:hypothetical protein
MVLLDRLKRESTEIIHHTKDRYTREECLLGLQRAKAVEREDSLGGLKATVRPERSIPKPNTTAGWFERITGVSFKVSVI